LSERSHYIEALFPEQYQQWEFMGRVRNTINELPSTKAYYAKENSVKGPFMPPSAVLNPSAESYKS